MSPVVVRPSKAHLGGYTTKLAPCGKAQGCYIVVAQGAVRRRQPLIAPFDLGSPGVRRTQRTQRLPPT